MPVDRMQEGQFVPLFGDPPEKGVKVIYMTNPFAEHAVQQLKEFDGKGGRAPPMRASRLTTRTRRGGSPPFCQKVFAADMILGKLGYSQEYRVDISFIQRFYLLIART